VLLLPEDPHECFERRAALDLADRLQTPVFVMTDLDIGMNQRLCKPFAWDDGARYDRGKVMTPRSSRPAATSAATRTSTATASPGARCRARTRARALLHPRHHAQPYARYSEAGPDYVYNMQRLLKKFATAKTLVPQPVLRARARRRHALGAIYFGSTSPAMDEALEVLEADGIHLDAMRLRAFPFPPSGARVHRRARPVFVVEQNRDAQMRTLLVNELEIDPARLMPVLHYDGTPITARFITRPSPSACARWRSLRGAGKELHRMTYIAKPRSCTTRRCRRNKVGYTRRDYEGQDLARCAPAAATTRISAAIIQACWELDIEPHRVAKLSGIGCSARRPTTSSALSHGFNTVHGRMPSVLTGANLANRDLLYLGVSGDGDSASIGLGQFATCHAARREHGLHRREQRRLRPDQGPVLGHRRPRLKSKKGVVNADSPGRPGGLALQLGATYVARGFSGDKAQLVPLIKGRDRATAAPPSSTSSAPAWPSTTTPAAPRATTTCASTTRRSTASTSSTWRSRDHRRLRARRGDRRAAARRHA
jgi:hypothetical protein